MGWLLAFAVLAQTADTVQSCHAIGTGGRELNPLMPRSCAGIVMVKGLSLAPLVYVRHTKARVWIASANLVAGGVGVTVSVVKR